MDAVTSCILAVLLLPLPPSKASHGRTSRGSVPSDPGLASVWNSQVSNGAVLERTYRADEKLDQALIDKREMQYLYPDGDSFVFMDTTDYEQINAPRAALGSAAGYLKEGDSAVLQIFDGEIVGVDLPAAVELSVTETEPGLQGDRVSGARKPATLETGLVLQVPLFVNIGDRVKVDTRSGEYLTRAGS